jgi:tRNA 2-selenouridine synthase
MTPRILTSLDDLRDLPADTIIDVRSPSEFAEDHVPGAINLPVLSDAQRAEVGTIYVQDSAFKARKIGGALVAQNTASHLQGPLAEHEGDWQALVYCWRGGQRSGAFATILDQVGWRVELLKGGYQSYRRLVVSTLYETPLTHRIMLIEGGTGTAKTALLHYLKDAGAQVLDLEGLAGHRGSLFGATPGGQPAQKMFETLIADGLGKLDPTRVTFVEAESSKIGERMIPPSLWAQMQSAPRIAINAPLVERAKFLCRAYADLTTDTATLTSQINYLRPYHARNLIEDWHTMAENADWHSLATGLISAHYDPRYAKSAADAPNPQRIFDLPNLDETTLAATAHAIASDIT